MTINFSKLLNKYNNYITETQFALDNASSNTINSIQDNQSQNITKP